MNAVANGTGGRFEWLERPGDDFPYYDGRPAAISGAEWGLVMLGVAAGYFALILLPFPSGLLSLVPAVLFCLLPLAALRMVAGGGWTAIFRPLRGVDFLWMLAFFALNWVVTIILGLVTLSLFDAQANPAGDMVAATSGFETVLFFVRTGIQLFGEEVFTILPFLALLWLMSARFGLSRRAAVMLAALGTSVIFALVHLPTYQWNVAQALVGLVPIRIVLLLPYIMTKNIWVSTGVHILNDWTIFGLAAYTAGGGAE